MSNAGGRAAAPSRLPEPSGSDPAATYPTGWTGVFPTGTPNLNRLLRQQLRIAAAGSPDGTPELIRLLETISRHYDAVDEERRGIVRSMQLMSDEAQALTREIREQTSAQLQAILDHIKDAIITVDEGGHIETFNPTGERIFGYSQAEVVGRTLDHLVPEAANQGTVADYLSRLAARLDDTHVDLAAHETWGRNKDGAPVRRGHRGERGAREPPSRLRRLPA